MALASASTFSGLAVRTPSGGEGLPKVCCRVRAFAVANEMGWGGVSVAVAAASANLSAASLPGRYFSFYQISLNTEKIITVRLLTHVLWKPTHFFFHSFIATMSYSLQTSFNSVMKDWADKCHVWGTPTRSPSRSNSR